MHECLGTAVGLAVDVSVPDGRPRIHRATAAIDVGLAVNPLTIEAQVQGGFGFGLIQLMAKGAITLKDGRAEQRNFDDFYTRVHKGSARQHRCAHRSEH